MPKDGSDTSGQRWIANSYRAKQRRRRHQSTEELAQDFVVPPIPELPYVPQSRPFLVESDDALAELVDHVKQAGSFGYDTEFIGELSYSPQLCLIQIATVERIALVDPFADLDITPVWELVADPDVETIVHAGIQDLEPVVRYLDRAPANVFDTQIAAGFAHLRYPIGLRDLVAKITDVELGKALTFTSWDNRPLSAMHQHYAADDVRYLPAVRAALVKIVEALHRMDWLAEELQPLTDASFFRFNPAVQGDRIKNSDLLAPRQRAVLYELVALRDKEARTQNVPPRTLVKDGVLMEMSRNPVNSIEELGRIRGLPKKMKQHRGQALLDATAKAKKIPKRDLPRVVSSDIPDPEIRTKIDALWKKVVAVCDHHSVDTQLTVSRRQVSRYCQAALSNKPLSNSPLSRGWRQRLLGSLLDEGIAGFDERDE